MGFTAWTLFVDLGLAAVLLLVGQLIRAKVVFVQRLFLPANVVAGALALALGPNGAELMPFSQAIGVYPGILIALVFASLPFASTGSLLASNRRSVGELWSYSTATMCLQWGLGMLFGLVVLRWVWPGLHSGFGSILASGFVGGHGTAAAVGTAFADRGWDEAGSLAMTSATVGILSAIVGGMMWIKWGTQNGATRFVARFQELPGELRTGLIPPGRRESLGEETVSPISIDPLVFHFSLIASSAVLGYFVGQLSSRYLGPYQLPTFSLAFLLAVVVKIILKSIRGLQYVDPKSAVRVCGSMTDLLVVFGIASIRISVLVKYVYPLLGLFVFGIVLCWVLFRFLGRRTFQTLWFERSLYTWGWVTGVMAMAIALLRIVDPENRSKVLDDFAIAYLALGPIEVALVSLAPILISQGHHWAFTLATVCAGLVTLALPLVVRGPRLKAS